MRGRRFLRNKRKSHRSIASPYNESVRTIPDARRAASCLKNDGAAQILDYNLFITPQACAISADIPRSQRVAERDLCEFVKVLR